MMSEEENSLNPILDLTFSISDGGSYTYYLTTSVPDHCVDIESKQVISDPDVIAEIASLAGYILEPGEVNMAVTYTAISCGKSFAARDNMTTITVNSEGKKGSIMVIVAPESTSITAGPETSGKAIIKFEKARPN